MKKRKASVINHSENRELNTDDQFLIETGQIAFQVKDFLSFVSLSAESEDLVDLAEITAGKAELLELDFCGDGSRARLADEALKRRPVRVELVVKQISQIF